jgi:hypothetical protein
MYRRCTGALRHCIDTQRMFEKDLYKATEQDLYTATTYYIATRSDF